MRVLIIMIVLLICLGFAATAGARILGEFTGAQSAAERIEQIRIQADAAAQIKIAQADAEARIAAAQANAAGAQAQALSVGAALPLIALIVVAGLMVIVALVLGYSIVLSRHSATR